MHQFEIVRLCVLWDSADIDKANIPTVIELIDDDLIIDKLVDETRSHWVNEATVLFNPSVEPTLNAAEHDARENAPSLRSLMTKPIRRERDCSVPSPTRAPSLDRHNSPRS